MFGLKKRKRNDLKTQMELQAALKSLEQLVVNCVREESVKDSVARVENRLKKQEGILEETLELLDGCQTGLEKLHGEQQTEKQQTEEQEEGLLELVMMYGEYMENLYRLMPVGGGIDPEWQEQWTLMRTALDRAMMECGVEMIRTDRRQDNQQDSQPAVPLQPADPSKIVVVKTERTSDPQCHNCVAETVIPGWIYQGRVVKKARVVIYKYEEDEKNGDNRN